MAYPGYLVSCCLGRAMSEKSVPMNISTEDILIDEKVTIACLVSSCVSLLGVVYLLLPRRSKDRGANQRPAQVLTFPSLKSVVFPLLVANVLGTSGILVRSVGWEMGFSPASSRYLNSSVESPHAFCVASNIWITFFYLCSFFWSMNYSVEFFLAINQRQQSMCPRRFVGWVLPALLTITAGLLLYHPSLSFCSANLGSTRLILTYLTMFVPIGLVFFFNPIVYLLAGRAAWRLLIRSGRFTRNERVMLDGVHLKCILIHVTFLVCWIPNILTAILQPIEHNFENSDILRVLWILMGITNPLQALFNCLVYRGWPGFLTNCITCCQPRSSELEINSDDDDAAVLFRQNLERDPILSFRRNPPRYT